MSGKLFLLPVSLGDANPSRYLPPYNIQVIDRLTAFIVENARSARQFIRQLLPQKDISSLTILEVDKHNGYDYPKDELLTLLRSGVDVGVMSEAGCPAVADPGAKIVKECHQNGIEVVPLVGPSSILLALMASGMDGQQFTFHGYLPHDKARRKTLLTQFTTSWTGTHIFIEAPYRNDALLDELLAVLPHHVRLCVAVDLTTGDEEIHSRTIAEWRSLRNKKRELSWHKRPAIFLINREEQRTTKQKQ